MSAPRNEQSGTDAFGIEVPAPRKIATGKKIVVWVSCAVAAFALATVGVFLYQRYFEPVAAEVGDCVSGDLDDPYSIRAVACDAPDAEYKVVGRVGNQRLAEFESDNGEDVCAAYDDVEYYYFEGIEPADARDVAGSVLCLAFHER